MNFKKLKKYHVSVFTNNLLITVVLIFLFKRYHQNDVHLLSLITVFLALFVAFFLIINYMLKEVEKNFKLMPDIKFLAFNIGITAVISLMMIKELGWYGVLFVVIFAACFFQLEHMVRRVRQ